MVSTPPGSAFPMGAVCPPLRWRSSNGQSAPRFYAAWRGLGAAAGVLAVAEAPARLGARAHWAAGWRPTGPGAAGQLVTSLNGVTSSVAFDTMGRVTTTSNPLGTFTYSYVNATGRLAQVIYPNAQTTTFSYWGNTAAVGTGNGDERLKEIKHLDPSSSVISKFNYEYDTAGQIIRWQQQLGALPLRDYEYGYDGANQLTSALLRSPISGLPSSFHYIYDKAGNRTTEQIDQQPTKGSFNNVNQLTQLDGGSGQMLVSGTTSKDTTVTVNGNSATVLGGTNFWAKVNVTGGTNTFTVSAKDFQTPPNTTTQSYQVVTSATGTSALSYDLNGNCTSDGTRTYEWDAKNQLIAINYTGTTKRTEFVYNGQGCRVKILEKESGSLSNLKSLIWNQNQILEERDATNITTKQYYPQGFVLPASGLQSPVSYFYARDHLGSIREVTDSSGSVHACYDYDPFGRMTKLSGDVDSDFLYTGHYYHALSNLHLAKYRGYDPNIGRWLSRDPLENAELSQGPNLYAYVSSNPISNTDFYGLFYDPAAAAAAAKAAAEAAAKRALAAAGGALGLLLMAPSTANPEDDDAQIKRILDQIKRDERKAYKARCTEPAPPGLTPCEKAKWELQRNKDCKRMREDFSKKWYDDNDENHQNEIKNLGCAIKKLEDWIEKNCK